MTEKDFFRSLFNEDINSDKLRKLVLLLKRIYVMNPNNTFDKELVYYRMSAKSITSSQQLRLKKTEMTLFFRQKFWYMWEAGMGWEAVKQMKYWIKIARMKEA